MEKMTDLKDLLKHEIKDLYSAEEQIIQAMPSMIEKVSNPQLKQALEMHLRVTEGQLKRLEQVQQLMEQDSHEIQERKNNGLFARLMRRRTQDTEMGSGNEKCLGMEGLLKEGEKVMGEEMEPSVLDAAIIACAQKIEHYEICGYGTARAYARELNMGEVAELLEQTLDEEYEADDRLTDLAVGRLNEEAEMGGARRSSRSSASSAAGRSSSRSTAPKSTARSRAGAAVAAKGSRGSSSSSGRSASSSGRSTTSSNRGTSSTRSTSSSSRSTGSTKAATKSSGNRGGSAAPASRTSASRSTSKTNGRSSSSANTRSAAGSRSSKAPSKAAAAKGGRNSSGGGRTASKSTGRGSSSGRSAGRR